MSLPKILFILKRREDFDPSQHTKEGMQTGLFNSASFVNHMLVAEGFQSKMVIAIDNNCIDRLIQEHKPTHVIIEALWVVPTKFYILQRLHPKVKWIIRLHSDTPFLAQEGMAFDWLGDYMSYTNVFIAANSPRMLSEVRAYLRIMNSWTIEETNNRIVYLPNYYPRAYLTKPFQTNKDHIDVSCFGAVRPLKNHMVQALAAIQFAEKINKTLRFHINARTELNADSVVNNLKHFFQHLHVAKSHELIFHTWTARDEFLKLCRTMDIGLQVSFSETFNIVGADLISQGVPLIGSSEIPWLHQDYYANPTDSEDIYQKIIKTYENPTKNVKLNSTTLSEYVNNTRDIWISYFCQESTKYH